MSELTETVDNLENRISKLLHKYEVLKRANQDLHDELASVKLEKKDLEKKVEHSTKSIHTLKAANAMLGSNEYKRETKLQINSLIREIDQCIVQLSE